MGLDDEQAHQSRRLTMDQQRRRNPKSLPSHGYSKSNYTVVFASNMAAIRLFWNAGSQDLRDRSIDAA
jgi:hypothetical protein